MRNFSILQYHNFDKEKLFLLLITSYFILDSKPQ